MSNTVTAGRPVPPPFTPPASPFADELHPDWCTATDARGCGVCGAAHVEIGSTFDDYSKSAQIAPVMDSETGKPGVDITLTSAVGETSIYFTPDEAEKVAAEILAAARTARRPVARATRPAVTR
ncbi:hypothetical protein [Catenuloplanes indicus]|uniref:Uncharacterized protein n=1 Tax=Catenuloplanes indicus TaxID=137267 RepID=A0AAE3VT00_9ACTN|nr:hypothetical protein [Catenuloplanes indicus]MDQ0363338.1 hypothetical protein [Catenuloplanes indicus]MDQ0371660.1 hypothetical protein [Catenuloplanes indicus]